MKSTRNIISYLLGWSGLAALVGVAVALGMYFDGRSFTEVKGHAAIHKLLAGYSLKAEGYTFFYAGDGRVVGVVGQNYDVGKWQALEDVYCEQWEIWGGGVRRCWTLVTDGKRVKRIGTGFPFNENNAPINELQRVEGNQIYAR